MQVLVGFVANFMWYCSLNSSGRNKELIKGISVVISSLAIFSRLFLNSSQVGIQHMPCNTICFNFLLFCLFTVVYLLVDQTSDDTISVPHSNHARPHSSFHYFNVSSCFVCVITFTNMYVYICAYQMCFIIFTCIGSPL